MRDRRGDGRPPTRKPRALEQEGKAARVPIVDPAPRAGQARLERGGCARAPFDNMTKFGRATPIGAHPGRERPGFTRGATPAC